MNKNNSVASPEEIAELVINEIAAEQYNPQSLLTAKMQKERLRHDTLSNLNLYFERISRGVALMWERLELLQKNNADLVSEKVQSELERFQSPPENVEDNSTKNLKDIFEISDETLSVCNEVALDYYNHHEYKEASDVFFILCTLNPEKLSFWEGLANASYFSKQFEEAVKAYTVCCQTDPDNALYHLYNALCLNELKRINEAIYSLTKVEEICKTTKDRNLSEEAEFLKQKIKR